MGDLFRPASRKAVKARIALAGPSGAGKTYTALALAEGFAQGGRVACIDTEKGSASLYADEFTFDVAELGPPFDPERYVEAIRAAAEAGYVVVVVDSLSHAWADEGGVLDIVDREAGKSGNKFAAWQKGTPAHNKLVSALVRAETHVIATMRSKMAYTQDVDKGRTTIRKVGLEPIQRDTMQYEFSLYGEIDLEHRLHITKSRFRPLQDRVIERPGRDVARMILDELERETPAAASEAGTEEAGAGAVPASSGSSSSAATDEAPATAVAAEEAPQGSDAGAHRRPSPHDPAWIDAPRKGFVVCAYQGCGVAVPSKEAVSA